jgi:hypothetical protein
MANLPSSARFETLSAGRLHADLGGVDALDIEAVD